MNEAGERLAAAPPVSSRPRRAGRAGRGFGSPAARSGTRRWGATWSTSTLPSPATRQPVAKAIARAGAGHSFELSAEFATWRAVAADHSWQIDVTALRGATIEADLGERDFTIGAVADAARRR